MQKESTSVTLKSWSGENKRSEIGKHCWEEDHNFKLDQKIGKVGFFLEKSQKL